MECQSLSYQTGIPSLRLEEFLKSYGDIVDDEHCISSVDRWSVGDDHTGFRGHVESTCPGS